MSSNHAAIGWSGLSPGSRTSRCCSFALDGNRRVLARERRSAEEPVLDRVPRPLHRRIGARLMKEQLVEEQRVAGLEDRAQDRDLAPGDVDLSLRDRVVEPSFLGGRREVVVRAGGEEGGGGGVLARRRAAKG